MRCLDGIPDSMDMSLSKLQEMVRTGKPGVLGSMGSQRVRHDCSTAQHRTQRNNILLAKWVDVRVGLLRKAEDKRIDAFEL